MKTRTNLYLVCAALALLVFPASGCGDSTECGPGTVEKGEQCVADQTIGEQPEVECGAGTVEEDGQCVPNGAQTECGPKTSLQDGQCVIAADACEAGENLDPNSGECVEAGGEGGTECGAGTALDSDSGTCIATEDVCDSGTIFDADSGLCLPDSCQVGDVLLGGICVSPAQELAAQADLEETENNDPVSGGTSEALTLKAVGEQTVFTGTIDAPTDLGGDGEVDQDLDAFHFEAEAGQWIQLTLQSTGIPSPAFMVEGPNGYQRFSPQLGGSDTARQLLIPVDGTYTVTVAPAAYVAALIAGDTPGGPYGGANWGYVGSLEELDAPTPVDVDATSGTLSGEYSTLADNFFNLTGLSEGDNVALQVGTSQSDASGILQTWADGAYLGAVAIQEGDSVNLLSPASGDLKVLIDWDTLGGVADGFELSAELQADSDGIGAIGADDSASTTPVDLDFGDTLYYTFDAEPGQVIAITTGNSNSSTVPTNIRLTDSSGTVQLPNAQSTQDFVSLNPDRFAYTYTKSGGTFQVEVTPSNGWDLEDMVINIATMTPTNLGDVAAGDNVQHTQSSVLTAWSSDFYLFNSAENVVVSGEVEGESGKQIGAQFTTDTNQLIANRGFQNNSVSLQETVIEAGITLLEVSTTFQDNASYTIDMDVAAVPQVEVEPNGGPALATTFDTDSSLYASVSGSYDEDYYTFTLPADMGADEVFSLVVDPLNSANTSYRCTLTDSNGDIVGAHNPHALNNGCVAMATGLLASETYQFHIESTRQHPESPLTYKLSATLDMGLLETEPNDLATSAISIDLDELQAGKSLYGTLPDHEDVDYYTFTLDADMDPGTTITLEMDQFGPFSFQYGSWELLDASENNIGTAQFYGAMVLENLNAGTYYMSLQRNSSGTSRGLVYRIDAI